MMATPNSTLSGTPFPDASLTSWIDHWTLSRSVFPVSSASEEMAWHVVI